MKPSSPPPSRRNPPLPRRRLTLRLAAALFVSPLATSCATAPSEPVLQRPVLPAPPESFGQPVAIPMPSVGLDARILAARRKAALLEANRRLLDAAAFYQQVIDLFGAPPDAVQ